MHDRFRPRRPSAETVCGLAIFLFPILIGVLFWADGSGNGDSIAYRQMIEATWREGRIPPARIEWYHPGQYPIAAPIFGLGQWLGLWTEPLRVCSLLNFLALGLAGWTVWRMFRLLFPERSGSLALFAGWTTVTVPGWLWHSQEAMTDVLGHALVLTWVARLLMHECKAHEQGPDLSWRTRFSTCLAWGFTGFLATYAILIRVSSALFGLLFLYLWVRALVATPSRRARITRSASLLLGGAIPVVGIFSHLILEYGWTRFWNIYLEFSSDNVGMKASFERLSTVWLERVQNGTGPVLFWGGICGAAFFLIQMIRPSVRRVFTSRIPLFWICAVLTVPYFFAVARNRSWLEFRYLVPAMMLLSLATTAWALIGDRLLGRWAPRTMTAVLVVANLIHAGPWLYTIATRTPFLEVAVKETIKLAEPGSLLLGNMSAAHMLYRSRGRVATMGVRYDSSEGGVDFWNVSWSRAREVLANACGNARHAYYYNEPGLTPFIGDLEHRGWKTKLVFERSFDGLRNAVDENLGTMRLDSALQPSNLQILRLIPPPGLVPPVTLEVELIQGDRPAYRLTISSPEHAGWRYRVILATQLVETGAVLAGRIYLPFGAKDPLVQRSLSMDPDSPGPLKRLIGSLDKDGRATIDIPAENKAILTRAFVTALLHRPGSPWELATLRSPLRRIP